MLPARVQLSQFTNPATHGILLLGGGITGLTFHGQSGPRLVQLFGSLLLTLDRCFESGLQVPAVILQSRETLPRSGQFIFQGRTAISSGLFAAFEFFTLPLVVPNFRVNAVRFAFRQFELPVEGGLFNAMTLQTIFRLLQFFAQFLGSFLSGENFPLGGFLCLGEFPHLGGESIDLVVSLENRIVLPSATASSKHSLGCQNFTAFGHKGQLGVSGAKLQCGRAVRHDEHFTEKFFH